jgi:hypothetical protein
MRRVLLLSTLVLAAVALACGGDDDSDSVTVSPEPDSGSPSPTPGLSVFPPLEGPDRGPAYTERTDFRTVPEWELPDPADLPPVPGDAEGAIYFPPQGPSCPAGWVPVTRPAEGFNICHPQDWQTIGNGYVSEGAEDRWYSHGMALLSGENRDTQVAHVSVYAIGRYSRPMVYTRDCPRPYAITLAGEDAVICPAFPADSPEQDFTSYHVRRGDLDYFIQVVRFDGSDDEAYDLAVQIAQTFQLIELSTP